MNCGIWNRPGRNDWPSDAIPGLSILLQNQEANSSDAAGKFPAAFFLFSFRFHRISQDTQPFDLDHDLIPIDESTDSGRGTGEDEIARLQGHDRGDIGNQSGNAEDQVPGRGHLARLTVNLTRDHGVGDIEVGIYPGPEWAKRVEALCTRPLIIRLLQVACSDVVANLLAEDMILGILGGDMPCPFPDHDHQFRFMLDLFRLRRGDDRLSRIYYRTKRL